LLPYLLFSLLLSSSLSPLPFSLLSLSSSLSSLYSSLSSLPFAFLLPNLRG
jgi:hypothetical protein